MCIGVLPGAASATQVTHHTKQPVRFLSIAADGRLCYGFDGEIYTLVPGGEPRKVNISIVSDKSDKDLIRQIKSSGATEMALSPNGKEVAFVLRGDVYVTSVDYKPLSRSQILLVRNVVLILLLTGVLWYMLPSVAVFGSFTLRLLSVRMKTVYVRYGAERGASDQFGSSLFPAAI